MRGIHVFHGPDETAERAIDDADPVALLVIQDRLLEVDPELDSFAYAAESYDAVIVSALAAVAAESDNAEALALEIPGVTEGGEKCTDFAACVELLEAGEDIDFDGASGPIELGETGSPTAASIGIYEYDAKNQIAPVEYIEGQI